MLWRMKSAELLTLLGVRIRTLRKANGITQERLAELADINLSYMSEIERGQANVSLCIVNEIANALGTTIPELFEGSAGKDFANVEIPDLFRAAEKLDSEKLTIFVAAVQGLLNGLQRA